MNAEQIRLIIAVSLSALVLFTWQMFFAPKENRNIITNQTEIAQEEQPSMGSDKVVVKLEKDVNKQENNIAVSNINIVGENATFTINNELILVDTKGSYSKNTLSSTTGIQNPIEIYTVSDNKSVKLNFEIKYDETNKIYHGDDIKNGVKLTLKLEENGKLFLK